MASSKTARRKRRRAKKTIQASQKTTWNNPSAISLTATVSFDEERLEAANESATISPTFRMTAYTGGKMQPPGFSQPVVVDLDHMEAGQKIAVFLDHEMSGRGLVGHATTSIESGQLFADGIVSADTESANIVVKAAKRGFPWQCSIGGGVIKKTLVKAGESRRINGRTHDGPFLHVRARLQEVSFVPIGADSETSAAIAAALSRQGANSMSDDIKNDDKDKGLGDDKNQDLKGKNGAATDLIDDDFREWLEARGHDIDKLNDNEIVSQRVEYELETEASRDRDIFQKQKNVIARLRASAAKEEQRQQDIRDLCKFDAPLRSQAIAEGWDKERTELEMYRKNLRQHPRSNRSSGDHNLKPEVIEAAICTQVGLDLDWLDAKSDHWRDPIFMSPAAGRGYSEQVLDQAVDAKEYNFFRLFHEFLHAAGVSIHAGTTMTELIDKVREVNKTIRASSGFSGINISGILSNVMNKTMLASFETVRPVAQRISSSRNVSDFKETKAFRLTGNGEFLPLGPTGEIQAMQLQEEEYANRASTYARRLTIPREMLINDDLGALNGVTRIIGRKGAMALQKRFFTVWNGLQSAGFFASGYANLVTTNALGIAGLTAAETAFLKQTDADGDPIDMEASTLLVPPDLKVTAEELMNATTTVMFAPGASGGDQATYVRGPDINPHVGKWNIEWSHWLSNSGITGYSTTSWYLLANPAVVAAMEIVWLNGKKVPTIKSKEMDSEVLGMAWDAWYDFGIASQDYRGAVKSTA